MKITRRFCQLATLSLILISAIINAQEVGFQKLQIPDENEKPIIAGLWYPSSTAAPQKTNTEFGQALSVNSPIMGKNLPLVAISHGYSGSYAGHADTAKTLAKAGFAVIAPSHTGNTGADMSSPVEKWVLERPRHISHIVNYLANNYNFNQHIDTSRYSIYGFSAGGNTVLNLIGGVPDLNRAASRCDKFPKEYVCAEGIVKALKNAKLGELPASAWGSDKRIRAAAIAAPGLGFAYSKKSLANVSAAVQLWSGEKDTSVPTASNAALIAANLPRKPETHWIKNASHFAFLTAPCRPAFKKSEPEEYAELCTDAEGFNRYKFHQKMNNMLVEFFKKSLIKK